MSEFFLERKNIFEMKRANTQQIPLNEKNRRLSIASYLYDEEGKVLAENIEEIEEAMDEVEEDETRPMWLEIHREVPKELEKLMYKEKLSEDEEDLVCSFFVDAYDEFQDLADNLKFWLETEENYNGVFEIDKDSKYYLRTNPTIISYPSIGIKIQFNKLGWLYEEIELSDDDRFAVHGITEEDGTPLDDWGTI